MSEFWKNYIANALCPSFLKRDNGKAFIDAIAEEKDELEADLIAIIEASMPSKCDASMLPILAKNRNVFIAPGETVDQFRKRIKSFRQDKQYAGTDTGIINSLAVCGLGGIKSPLGCDTVIVKNQAQFTPSWDMERFANLPSWMATYGSNQYKIADASSSNIVVNGYLGDFTIKTRFAYGWASVPADDYVWYLNYNNNLFFRVSDRKFVLKINGYTLASNIADFAANDLITIRIIHSPSLLRLFYNGGVFTGTTQGAIIAYTPLDDNPLAFYEASASGVRLYDSTHIDRLYDLGSSGDSNRIAVQNTLANMPTYTAIDSNFNGHGTITPTALTWMQSQSVSIPSNISIYGVASVAVGTLDCVMFSVSNADGSKHAYITYNTAGNVNLVSSVGSIAKAITPGSKIVFCATVSSTTCNLYVNNVSTPSTSNIIGINTTLTSFTVGDYFVGGLGYSYRSPIATIGLYTGVHDTAIRTRIMQYLGSKYGITVS